jgi:hypothetical protein
MRLQYILLGFLLLSSCANGKKFVSHTIEVDLSVEGNARIIERFRFELQNISEFDEFESYYPLVSQWEALQDYSSEITPFIINAAPNASIDGPSGQYGIMNLEYKMDDFAEFVERIGITSKYKIPREKFLFEDLGGNVFIPEKTILVITLPEDAEVVEEYPLAAIELKTENRKTAEWRGPLAANDFIFIYGVHSPIEESVGLEEIWRIATTFTSAMILVTILIGLIILILFRGRIFRFLSKGFSV